MLSESQRTALAARLRRGGAGSTAGRIARRDPGMVTPPASAGQEQLWFLDQFAPGQAVYNIPCVIRIRGPLDTGALGRALSDLIGRHETLRTRLVTSDSGRPVQVIDPPGPVVLDVEDLSGFEPVKRQARLREILRTESMRPFDLAAGPLMRECLIRLAADEHVLAAVIHHAMFDGWSAKVLLRDLAALYAGEVTGEPSGLEELPVQFADYAIWEQERLRGPAQEKLESYWRQVMDGFETIQFAADRPRPVIDRFDGALAVRQTDRALLDGLRELSRREDVTLFVTVMAALQVLLHRYTGQTDLVVGTVSANRSRGALAPLIGFLVNTLPIRADLSGDPEFTQLLPRVKEAVIGAFAHQDLPFGKLVDAVGVERDASRAPVFQIALTFAERDDTPVLAAGAEFAASDLVAGIDAAKFDLTFATEVRREGLWIECSYKTALFDRDTTERLVQNFEMLLRGVAADPSARLSELPLLTDAELRAELRDWNDTAASVPSGCVHERFEAQAARAPDAVAAEFEDEALSYRELNEQANQIARRLRELGVGPERLVGVCMGNGLRRLAALLGIWKAGGGYVPLDPALPAGRLAFMIADTGMRVIVTDDPSQARVPDTAEATVVSLDAERAELRQRNGGNLDDTGVTPANVAYVLYTSGSTGQPKGVVVEHRNVVNFLHGMTSHWEIGPADTVLQFASFTFDVSVMDMFMPLTAGARVVLAAPETLHSPPRLAALMRDAKITYACLPPAVLGLLPDGEYPDLRILMAAGEELPSQVARRWIRPGLRLVNGYGPTETTVLATYAELDPATPMPPPIGFPVWPNYQAYVLDPHLNPVPAGAIGELHIGGASVARGYLNRPDLTRQRFIPDPFGPASGRLYKTGDLVRRRPDGSIVFTGRVDHQVKIHGLRIEIGEIEAALATHPAIAQAVVTVVTGSAGDKELAAYLRPAPGTATSGISDQDVRAHLARTLPAGMIPAHLITISQFPLNASGKVDKQALPAPRRQMVTSRAVLETPGEAMLAGLYATLLGTGPVGATDSFFDLGGNSLTAMRLVDMISRETGADLGVSAVFLHRTPRRLAAAIEALSSAGPQAGSGPIVQLSGGVTEPPLFLLHAVGGTVSAYVPLAQELAGTFKVYGLESPGLRDTGAVAPGLHDLVADYTRRIREVQPAGPYRLAGWSMGGVIAFEVAQRLELDGAGVDLLILLDPPFAIPADFVPDQAQLAGRFVADAAHTLGWDTIDAPNPAVTAPAAQLAWLAARLSTGDSADDGADSGAGEGADEGVRAAAAQLQQRFDVFEAHSRMLAGYQPAAPRVRAPTLIVSATASPNAPARMHWPAVLTGPVAILRVDSDHYAFLRPPLVADVGASIRKVHNDPRQGRADGV
jgi:amino acid adenylation domain-containing protein